MTIPSTNSKLLVTEDWKKLYQSFPNAEFQSYDFDTLRRVIISYLQENYPEDFNDFIDSSEYVALIDIIAFLGQNLSFRIDLNARENFLETAQRRDSILQLAQLISYFPKRNLPANGLLKVTSISTTDNIFDSLGTNLANTTVLWNDPTNSNWYQQFISIFNASLIAPSAFGNPSDQKVINGIFSQQYKINSANTDVPVYSFSKNINGIPMPFEIVSSAFSEKTYIYEEAPKPGNAFSLIYQNDNQGNSSSNTGFFAHFRQGKLGVSNFTINNPVPNEIVGVNVTDINDTDLWLWQVDLNGSYNNLWTQTPSTTGNNVIYNSLNSKIRNFYSVSTQNNDQINLNFSDGNFGNLPSGRFSLLYRQSNGLTYAIKPEQMAGVTISIPYTNAQGLTHTLTMGFSLQYTINNSSGPETNESIKQNAPQTYYIQNRMITAEDYNIAPLNIGSEILKVKSVARVASGVSKYFDLSDVSGKYSSTNIFADDGIVYKNVVEQNFKFSYSNQNDVFVAIRERLAPIVASNGLRSFYFDKYSRPDLSSLSAEWNHVNKLGNQSQGYLTTKSGTVPIPISVGSFSSNNFSYLTAGSLVKFVPPTGKYFLPNGNIVNNKSSKTLEYLWASIVQVISDGSNNGAGRLSDGTGPITLSIPLATGAIPVEIIPVFSNKFTNSFETEIANLCLVQRNFGLSFDLALRSWNIISDSNLDLNNVFSLNYQNDSTNTNKDSSWLVAFVWTGTGYTVRYRIVGYVFESEKQTGFFVDTNSINYDFTTDSVVKDKITVLSVNTLNTTSSMSLGNDYIWQIDSPVIESDGYVDPKKVNVSFYDFNNSGQITDPDTFENIVQSTFADPFTGNLDKFVYFYRTHDNVTYQLVDSSMFRAFPNPKSAERAIATNQISPTSGDLFYFYESNYNVVNSYTTSSNVLNSVWVYGSEESRYTAYPGRDGLKFQYVHNSGQNTRIDPSKSNVIDVYLLTSGYDSEFRNWILSGASTLTKPLPPTSSELENNYSNSLESIKSISDQIIYQPASYKLLFGPTADLNLQATFKAVQNPTSTLSSHDITTKILDAINTFFALENWNFGQSFYFSELSTYVMNLLTPDITNFIVVPVNPKIGFGSFYEIACQSNEIFISSASASDIQVIPAITASQLNASSIITNAGI
jgi:hypothetical protein